MGGRARPRTSEALPGVYTLNSSLAPIAPSRRNDMSRCAAHVVALAVAGRASSYLAPIVGLPAPSRDQEARAATNLRLI